MIRIAFSPPRDLEIAGTCSELRALRAEIDGLEAGSCDSAADIDFDPRPYVRTLRGLRVRVATGPSRVAIEQDVVLVTGSRPALKAFATFFDFDAANGVPAHHHHEHFEGNDWVHEESIPLVVTMRAVE